jgi:hypothetical protein
VSVSSFGKRLRGHYDNWLRRTLYQPASSDITKKSQLILMFLGSSSYSSECNRYFDDRCFITKGETVCTSIFIKSTLHCNWWYDRLIVREEKRNSKHCHTSKLSKKYLIFVFFIHAFILCKYSLNELISPNYYDDDGTTASHPFTCITLFVVFPYQWTKGNEVN